MGKSFDEIVKIIDSADLTVEDMYQLNNIIVKKSRDLTQNIRTNLNVGDNVKLNSNAKGKIADKYRNDIGIITKIMVKNVVIDFCGNDVRCSPSLLTKI